MGQIDLQINGDDSLSLTARTNQPLRSLPAYSVGRRSSDLGEEGTVSWENAWIDIGGEG